MASKKRGRPDGIQLPDYGRIMLQHVGKAESLTTGKWPLVTPIDMDTYLQQLELTHHDFERSNLVLVKIGSECLEPYPKRYDETAAMHSLYNRRGFAGDFEFLLGENKGVIAPASALIAWGYKKLAAEKGFPADYEGSVALKYLSAVAGKEVYQERIGEVMKERGIPYEIMFIRQTDVEPDRSGNYRFTSAVTERIERALAARKVVILNEDDAHTYEAYKMPHAYSPSKALDLPFMNNEELTRIAAYTMRHTRCTPKHIDNAFPPVEEFNVCTSLGCAPFYRPFIFVFGIPPGFYDKTRHQIAWVEKPDGLEYHEIKEKSDIGRGGVGPKFELSRWGHESDVDVVILSGMYNKRDRYNPPHDVRTKPLYSALQKLIQEKEPLGTVIQPGRLY